jgi:hypothetical protein
MARCPAAMLEDIADLLADVRDWPEVLEKSPGVFYARRLPFLHFHLTREGARRADVRGRAGWTSLELPRPLTRARRRALLSLLAARHRERAATPQRAPARRSAARR